MHAFILGNVEIDKENYRLELEVLLAIEWRNGRHECTGKQTRYKVGTTDVPPPSTAGRGRRCAHPGVSHG